MRFLSISLAALVSATGAVAAQTPGSGSAFNGVERGAVVETHLEGATLRQLEVATFDVLRLRLGMSFNEANRIAASQGFRPDLGGNQNFSFEGQAWLKANNRISSQRQADPFKLMAPEHSRSARADGAKLIVNWLPTSSGVRIHDLTYSAPSQGSGRDELVAKLIAKYGKPTRIKHDNNYYQSVTINWCSPKEPVCLTSGDRLPRMEAVVSINSFSIFLSGGAAEVDGNKRAIEVRADKIVADHRSAISF